MKHAVVVTVALLLTLEMTPIGAGQKTEKTPYDPHGQKHPDAEFQEAFLAILGRKDKAKIFDGSVEVRKEYANKNLKVVRPELRDRPIGYSLYFKSDKVKLVYPLAPDLVRSEFCEPKTEAISFITDRCGEVVDLLYFGMSIHPDARKETALTMTTEPTDEQKQIMHEIMPCFMQERYEHYRTWPSPIMRPPYIPNFPRTYPPIPKP